MADSTFAPEVPEGELKDSAKGQVPGAFWGSPTADCPRLTVILFLTQGWNMAKKKLLDYSTLHRRERV